MSPPTSTPSSGRDKICVVWDLRSHQATRTVPVFEVGIPGCPASRGEGGAAASNQLILRAWRPRCCYRRSLHQSWV